MTRQLRFKDYTWELGRKTYIMGILNITPDSFSDGGRFFDQEAAIQHALEMCNTGADIIDIGGESTRPGYSPVTAEEEIERVVPVIEFLKDKISVPVSVDTYRAETAKAAIDAGVALINDIWGLKADPELAPLAGQYGIPVCIMHNRSAAHYDNLIEDMLKDLGESIDIALKNGVKDENIIIDPGIGFGKTYDHNIQVMRHLEEFTKLGYPVLLGTSRKSFIGLTLGLPVDQRVEGTAATTVVGIMKGVDIVRVHDVVENKRAALMTDRMVR